MLLAFRPFFVAGAAAAAGATTAVRALSGWAATALRRGAGSGLVLVLCRAFDHALVMEEATLIAAVAGAGLEVAAVGAFALILVLVFSLVRELARGASSATAFACSPADVVEAHLWGWSLIFGGFFFECAAESVSGNRFRSLRSRP